MMLGIALSVAYIYQIILMNAKFGLLLRMGEVKASWRTKTVFTLGLGSLVFAGDFFKLAIAPGSGYASLIPLVSSIPGVIIAFVTWTLFVKKYKFKIVHALEVAVYTYLYFQTITGVTRLAGAIFFPQNYAQINYSSAILSYIVNFSVCIAIYIGMHYILDHWPKFLIVKENETVSSRKGFIFSFFQLFVIYICAALIMILVPPSVEGSLISLFMLLLFTAFSISVNTNNYSRAEIRDNESKMQSLFRSLDQFSAIKHDFYNILQTYNGYFEIGDLEACKRYHQTLVKITTNAGDLLDLSRRAVENPALIALLLNKHERAEALNIKIHSTILCPISNMPIEDIDICRVVACLMDNAIESAAESKDKAVTFEISMTDEAHRVIRIINSTDTPERIPETYVAGETSKRGHLGIGLVSVRRIMDKYPDCKFELTVIDNEAVAVIGLLNRFPFVEKQEL